MQNKDSEATNHVKALYAPFTQEELSQKIAELLTHKEIKCPVKIIYQTIEGCILLVQTIKETGILQGITLLQEVIV